jgi:hypothetical protein
LAGLMTVHMEWLVIGKTAPILASLIFPIPTARHL